MIALVLLTTFSLMAQQPPEAQPKLKTRDEAPANKGDRPWVVPAGTRIPIQLQQPVSTKDAQPGDAIYARTTFPILVDGNVMIPPGTYVQGVVDSVKRAGRIKGTAELRFHLTTLIYQSGYSLNLAALVEQVPGNASTHMKEPGTVQHDSEKGRDLENVGKGASEGAMIGSTAGALSGSLRGVGIGGVSGIAAGTLIAILTRGTDVRFDTGTVVDVALAQAVPVDKDKVAGATASR
ncbi:MAG: hypothetical protein ABSF98_21805 [Bryobacteraceae bacterium]|jgi:hypothetical protein